MRKKSIRSTAKATLHTKNEPEERVRERMRQLEETNAALLREIAERARAEQALRENQERLSKELASTKELQRISNSLIEAENDAALYEQIIGAARAVMHSDMVSMQMLFPEKNELRLLVWGGFQPESAVFSEWVKVESKSTCGVALATGKRVIVSNVDTCDFMKGTDDLHYYHALGICAVQSTPLVSRSGKIVGMISNHWKNVHEPSERELDLLDVIARQAADLMERMQAQDALRESEERYRTLFNSIDEGFALCELVRDEDGKAVDYRALELSPSIEKFMGMPNSAQLHRTARELFPDLDSWWVEKYADIVKGNKPDHFEQHFEELDRWYAVSVYPRGGEQFALLYRDITERKRAEQVLLTAHDELEQRVAERTQQLAASNQERQQLLHQVLTIQEQERSRLARELHDELAQHLTALSLKLGLLDENFDTSRAHRIELDEILSKTMQAMQSLAVELRPPALDLLGLPETLQNYFEEWVSQDGTGGEFESVGLDGTRLSPDVEIVLYRITQEALTNIRKHAHAGFVNMIIERRGELVSLIIEDDGQGFDVLNATSPSDGRRPLGLLGIRERAALVGGTVEIESSDKGTTLFVRIPIDGNGER